MTYTTERTIRLASFMLAVVVASVLNGSLLWKFDDIAQNPTLAHAAPTDITLEPVTIIGHRS